MLVFSSGHFSACSPRWLGLEPIAGKPCCSNTASLSVVGYEHNLDEPVIRLWNDDEHVVAPDNPTDSRDVAASIHAHTPGASHAASSTACPVGRAGRSS